ncbi:MAG: multiheme c-type cytochrome [bacterium]|nr:multiheme c-type cytochrome [bacterium]MDT8396674.1 multiheme c-type cytochrome [bacterium]
MRWVFSAGAERSVIGTLLVLLILAPVSAAGARNPHAFMDEPSRCLHCHESRPIKQGGRFVKDIVSLCRDCHSVVHRMSHPVDIRPQGKISDDLSLDNEGTMTCATCHDPHSASFSSKPYLRRGIVERLKGMFSSAGYSTYYLRKPNTEGELCLSCHEREEVDEGYLEITTTLERDYTGSRACERCHEDVYRQWSLTSHARTLRDPRENPRAIAAVFTGEETFKAADVEFVIGVHWTQRYAIERDGELRIAKGVWSLDEDKWVRSTWREQLWRESCSGCHLTGYDPYQDTWVEKGVGCEMCHGPGGDHVRTGKSGHIVNPADLEWRLSSSICASCHTNGHDRTGQFRFPVGYLPGDDLAHYYRGLLPHVGQGEDTFKGDGSLEDRLRSFAYWLEQFFKPSRFTCKQCKSLHIHYSWDEAAGRVDLTKAQYCLSCHEEIHDDPDHRFETVSDVDCSSCHEPLDNGLGRPSIHDHKFIFAR